MRNQTLEKVTRVLTRLGEVAHWIAAVGALVGLVLTFFNGTISYSAADAGMEMNVYGFEIMFISPEGVLNMAALRVLLVAAILLYGLMAMVFRNVHLILKNSENTTPFQKDNVRMVKEVGIFLVAQPVVGLVMSIVAHLVLGEAETSMNMYGIVIGLVVLCLSQFFARGLALESDVDGLV